MARPVHSHWRVTTKRAWSGLMSLGEMRDGSQQPIGSPSRRSIPFHDAGGGSDDPPSPNFFFSSRRRHTRSVSAFLLNRSSDLILILTPQRQKLKFLPLRRYNLTL